MWNRLFRFFVALLTDQQVEKRYVAAGSECGDAISYIPAMGPSGNIESLLKRWARWEEEYARRGYRTVHGRAFVEHGGWGAELEGVGIRRAADEQPIFYAQ